MSTIHSYHLYKLYSIHVFLVYLLRFPVLTRILVIYSAGDAVSPPKLDSPSERPHLFSEAKSVNHTSTALIHLVEFVV